MTPIPWATDSDEVIIQWVRDNRINQPIVFVPLNSMLQEAPNTAEVDCTRSVVTRRFNSSAMGRPT